MKKMLIAASAVGAAIASLLLYLQKQNKNKELGTGFNMDMHKSLEAGSHRAQHTMG